MSTIAIIGWLFIGAAAILATGFVLVLCAMLSVEADVTRDHWGTQ